VLRPSPLLLALLVFAPACSGGGERALYSSDANALMGSGPALAAAAAPSEGFLFFAPLKSRFTYLLDGEGKELHKWESAYFPGAGTRLMDDGSILRCGRLVDPPTFTAGGQGGRIQRIAWDGTLTWDYEFSSEEFLHHHDVAPMPNGNVLLLAWERKTAAEALARGRDPELQKDEEFWPDWIVEIALAGATGGTIVWEWHAWDHMIQDRDPALALFGSVADSPHRIDVNGDREPQEKSDADKAAEAAAMAAVGYAGDAPPAAPAGDPAPAAGDPAQEPPPPADAPPGGPPPDGAAPPGRPGREADWMHSNSIDYHPQLDLIVISVRRFSEAWVIDHSTTTAEAATGAGGRHGRGGDLLYRWGNPRAHKGGSEEDRILYKQHHVQWIPSGRPGGGDFICFNNGDERPAGKWSSIEQWRMPIGADGRIGAGPVAPGWSWKAAEPESFYSGFISGVERLPNGSTLAIEGITGRLVEIASDGKVVWEWSNLFGGEEEPADTGPSARVPPKALFRASKIPLDHPVAGLLGR
jgi:hypothetical protein